MKQELFNIGEYEGVYEDIDHLDYRKLEDLNGDNLFFAFLKENEEVTLNCVAAINHKIYNFNTHKFIGDNVEITYDGIEMCAEILKGMVKTGKINLPKDADLDIWIEDFKSLATDELDKYGI